jgi:ABC-type transport system involved in cytochrome c biogenesis permease subunit
MNTIPLLLYFAAAAAYLASFVTRRQPLGQIATTTLGIAILAHTFVIGMVTMTLGHVPFAGITQAVSMFVWLLSLAYFYTEMTTGERSIGVFIVPLLFALEIIPTVEASFSDPSPIADILRSPWFGVHVASLLFAYASFALAAVIGVTYVLLFKEIKAKHLGFFYNRLPSLQVLDKMNLRAVTIGWVFLTVGVVVGAVWAVQARMGPVSDPRLDAMSLFDPKIFVALICWVVYSFELYARQAIGWHGRRAAWLSTIGFAIVLLNFLPVGYFFTRSHSF